MSLAGINRWTTAGPEAAAVGRLAIDPADPNHIFAPAGTLFESWNGGASWGANRALNGSVYSVKFDPTALGTVYAVGAGFFKSVDGGRSWVQSVAGLEAVMGSSIGDVAIDASTPSTLYVSSYSGVFRSTDGGCSWTALTNGLPGSNLLLVSVAVDSAAPFAVYIGSLMNGAFRSVDHGDSWAPVAIPSPYRLYGMAFDAVSGRKYAATQSYFETDGSSGGRIFSSEDGGASWTALTNGLPESPYFGVTIDPISPDTLYCNSGRDGIFKSTDAGASWSPVNAGLGNLSVWNVLVHPDNLPFVFAATLGSGVFVSADSGASWAGSNDGMGDLYVMTLAVDTAPPGAVYVGAFGAGTGAFKSTDGGASWRAINVGLPAQKEVDWIHVDRATAGHLLAGLGSWQGAFESWNSGESWAPISDGITESVVGPFAIDPANPARIFAGSPSGLYRTLDAGASWGKVGFDELNIESIVIDAALPSRVLALVALVGYVSLDGGDSWNPLPGLAGYTVYSMAQNPLNPSLLIGVVTGGLLRSADGGVSWVPSSAGLPAEGVANFSFDPADPMVAWCATPVGAFRSADGGSSWNSVPSANTLALNWLQVSPDGSILHAATTTGVFELQSSKVPAPVVASVSPRSGDPAGGTPIVIAGQNFSEGAIVRVGDGSAVGVLVQNPSQIAAVTPSGVPGRAVVDVGNPDSQSSTVPATFVYDFSDVAPGNLFHGAVVSVVGAGLSNGCGAGRFCPSGIVSREQAAVLMEKAIHGPGYAYLPPGSYSGLADVAPCAASTPYVYQLLSDHISAGCGPNVFCPSNPVKRNQIAVFLLRAEHGADYVPPPATGLVFQDVQPGDFGADFIEQLAAEGITGGCGGGNYCPQGALTRGQLSALLARTFDLP